MSTIVNSGTTLTVTAATNLTLGADGTVASGGLLDGAGNVGGMFALVNSGTIAADQAGPPLNINTGTFANAGTVRASGGALYIQSSVATPDLSGGTLSGGAWESTGNGDLRLLTGLIVANDATITLDGAGSGFGSFDGSADRPLESSLATIGTAGVLNVLGGRDFQMTGTLQVDGTVTLGGGLLFGLNGIMIGAQGLVSGFGDLEPQVQDDGAIVAHGGTLSVPTATSLTGTGALRADAGATLALRTLGVYGQAIVNDGTIEALNAGVSGTLSLGGSYRGSGGFLIQGGFDNSSLTILDLAAGVSGKVAFDANFGELLLESPASFNGTVSGFGNNDSILLSGVSADQASLSGNVLTLTNNGVTVQTMTLDTGALDYSGATFAVAASGASDTSLTVSGTVACYREGTRIATPRGEVRVEDLAPGDIVLAHFAERAAVVWVGHRRVDCRRHPTPEQVWPVRVAAGAFGPGTPSRDLFLSPDHAVFVEGALIPIRHLINGATIAQVPMDEVIYHHVELEAHDILLAEGLPAESWLENGDRNSFDNGCGGENGGGVVTAHPVFGAWRWEALGCAPLVVAGPGLRAARALVAAVPVPATRRAA